MKKKIILDTDILLTSIKFKIDIFSELERICDFPYEIFIIDKTLDELSGKKNEKIVIELLKKRKVEIINTKKNKRVDDLILDIIDKTYIVGTQDKDLKNRLKAKGIPIIIIRKKNRLIFE